MVIRSEEIVGFLAFGLNVWGNWALTKKSASGWWLRLACNAAQLTYASLIWSPSLLVSAATFAAINVVGLRRWAREQDGHSVACATRQACTCGRSA